ncbi:GAF domain-containing protein [Ruegeria hyattellae]|uniref:GAF domain-containing protein n=1 Tax=Ruegeria hyattellae TaxID=3233337 RepID=UPI00355BE497
MTPDEIFAALHRVADAECGARLFTVTVLDRKAKLARRAYSSHPLDYPVTGTKPMGSNDWTELVLERGEPFVANQTAEFASYFSDHALINALGCEAVVNIPVSKDGLVIGTVNILDKAGHFTHQRVALLKRLVDDAHADLHAAFEIVQLEEKT